MIENNQFKRIARKHTIKVNASKEELFPLLCPVRESEWMPGFSSQNVYSESGFAELHCIFQTGPNEVNKTIWIIPVYEKDNFIEFIYHEAKIKVVIIKLSLSDLSNSETSLQVEYIYTSLSEDGNTQLEGITEEAFKNQINSWEICLNYFFKNGTIIPDESLLHHYIHHTS